MTTAPKNNETSEETTQRQVETVLLNSEGDPPAEVRAALKGVVRFAHFEFGMAPPDLVAWLTRVTQEAMGEVVAEDQTQKGTATAPEAN